MWPRSSLYGPQLDEVVAAATRQDVAAEADRVDVVLVACQRAVLERSSVVHL